VTHQIFDRQVQIRLGSNLRKRLVLRADRDGVHVATWARNAILASLKVSPAKVPQLTGGEKLSIRFRSTDFKRIEDAQGRSGRKLSDYLRALLTRALS
jgi:hypothetical protein